MSTETRSQNIDRDSRLFIPWLINIAQLAEWADGQTGSQGHNYAWLKDQGFVLYKHRESPACVWMRWKGKQDRFGLKSQASLSVQSAGFLHVISLTNEKHSH